jgi:hypothetical protein
MRIRPLVLCVVLAGAALGAAGCTSSSGSANSKPPIGTLTGTVTVRSGGKVVCIITLDKNGTGACRVSTTGDKPGQITYTGTYNGSWKSSTGSATVTLKPAQ